MRRSIARGRMVPQSISTDPRLGRVSLEAATLHLLMWVNCDDQGRLTGDPDEVKYATCPNRDEISKAAIPELLTSLEEQSLLKTYPTPKGTAIQMVDWWDVQKLQWAYPSQYPPPEGWADHLRYHPIPTEIVTENWPPSSQLASELLPSKPASKSPSALPSKLQPEVSQTLPNKEEKEGGKRRGRGRGRVPSAPASELPSALGSKSSPSPTTDQPEILKELTKCFRVEWGRVPAREPDRVIPREPGARESAQLRDLAKELAARGGLPLVYIQEAFREAAVQKKFHISYARAVLFDWLGLERGPPAAG